jgi:hypothetical protein
MPLLDSQALGVLLSHQYALKLKNQSHQEEEHGGYGEAIALSYLMQCKELIAFFTEASCIMVDDAEQNKQAKIEKLLITLKTSHPFPSLLENDLLAPWPEHEATTLFYFRRCYPNDSPLARDLLMERLRYGATQELSARLIQHMNAVVRHVISEHLIKPGEQTYFLLESINAGRVKDAAQPQYTAAFMFRADNIKATCSSGGDEKETLNDLLVWLGKQLHNKKAVDDNRALTAIKPKPQRSAMTSAAMYAGFFAIAACGITGAINYFQRPPSSS